MIPIYTNALCYGYDIPTTLVPQTVIKNKLSYYQFNDLKLKNHKKHEVTCFKKPLTTISK